MPTFGAADHKAIIKDDHIKLIEARFHDLMRHRATELDGTLPADMPKLMKSEIGDEKYRWLPIDGMYGGFKYRLEGTPIDPRLVVESWSRVVGYSGTTHVITPFETTLTESGFG